jgi:hypothetical protein
MCFRPFSTGSKDEYSCLPNPSVSIHSKTPDVFKGALDDRRIRDRAVPATQAIREEDKSENQLMCRVNYSDDCSSIQEVPCSQKQASSRKATAITQVEEQSERYLIDLPYTAFTKGVSP